MALPRGRPTMYSKQLAERVCKLIAGGRSLREIQKLQGMPKKSTVLAWLADGRHVEFESMYDKAKEIQAIFFSDEAVYIVKHEKDAQRMKAQLEFIRWYAAVNAPKRFRENLSSPLGEMGGGVNVGQIGQVVLMLPDNGRAVADPSIVIERGGQRFRMEEEQKLIEDRTLGMDFLEVSAQDEERLDELEEVEEQHRLEKLRAEKRKKSAE